MSDIKFIGLKELKAAVRRNPRSVKRAADTFLTRGLAEYRRGIINDPWRVGGRGGGAPVSNDPRYRSRSNRGYQKARSGNLRDSHKPIIRGLQGFIGPNESQAPYAKYVHGNKAHPVRVKGTKKLKTRPWLDYVKDERDVFIKRHYRQMLRTISRSLAQ